MKEQSILKSTDRITWLERHLAISLACGLDGKKRDFREVFEIMQKFYYFQSLANGVLPEQAKTSSNNKAWTRCVRTFRGTDCSTKGKCYTKDIAYAEGNIGVWDVISKNPGMLAHVDIGKFDPTNPRHIWILVRAGILPGDIENPISDNAQLLAHLNIFS